jgi:polysaccharide deacetylase family protein (PEP-CTERM system associated)
MTTINRLWTPRPKTQLDNALTIDVEDWYHVAAFFPHIDRTQWASLESRVERNTERLLAILAERNIRATFFVLGLVAEARPQLIRKIAAAGHEIASHGYSHELVYRQTPETFRSETYRAKAFLEDLLGRQISGYRASTYSITRQSLWALDILIDAGFEYDSSLFPVRHPQYGIPGAPRFATRFTAPSGRSLVEFPLSTAKFFKASLPVAGGGYFRIFPYLYTKWGLTSINQREHRPFIFYLHPWEIDPAQPRVTHAGITAKLRHYTHLDSTEGRLMRLFTDFKFTTVRQVLENQALLLPPATPRRKFRTQEQVVVESAVPAP